MPEMMLMSHRLFKLHALTTDKREFTGQNHPCLERNLVGVRSLSPSCFQASSLVLVLEENDRRNIGGGIWMIFNLICGVNVILKAI